MTTTTATARAGLWRFEPGGWLLVRLILGVAWVRGGWEKIGDAGWTAEPVGGAVEGFLKGAIAKSTAGPHPEVPHWYHNLVEDVFLPRADLFAWLVAYGELLIGIALVIGLLTRVSALAGITMNLAYVWAGTTSTNPPMLLLGLGLLFFGQRAGRFGADGWLLPRLRRRVPERALTIGGETVFAAALLAGAWLTLVTTDRATWLAVAALAAAVTIGARRLSRAD